MQNVDEIKQEIVACGGLEPIIKLLSHPNSAIQKGAATAIANLVENRMSFSRIPSYF